MKIKPRFLVFFLVLTIASQLLVSISSSPTDSGISESQLPLTVQTDKLFYLRGELARISGSVKDTNDNPIEEAIIGIEVKDPNDNTIFLDIVYSSPDGSYEDSFRLSSTASLGQYTVFVTASKTGCPVATNEASFYVTADDLFVENVEPVQVVFGASALVEAKATIIEAEVGNAFAHELATDLEVTCEYFTFDGGIRTTLTRIETHVIPVGRTNLYLLSDTPIYPGEGTLNATVKIDSSNGIPEFDETNNLGSTDQPKDVKDTQGLRVLYVPLNFIFESPVIGDRMHTHQYGSDIFVKATYPIAFNKYISRSSNAPVGLVIPFDFFEYLYALGKIELARNLLHYDRAIAVVPSHYDPSDSNSTWLRNWFGLFGFHGPGVDPHNGPTIIVEEGYWTAVAHELGHSYSIMVEEYEINPPGNPATGYWIEPSMNPITDDRTDGPITNGFCFMGSSVYQSYSLGTMKVWVDNDHYEYLLSRFKLDPLDPELLFVSGFVFENDTVRLNPWYRISQGIPDINLGASGNYSLQFLNSIGELIGQTSFNVSFYYAGSRQNATAFSFTVPYVPNTTTIQIIHNETIVASRDVSLNPPIVTVTYPNGGEIFPEGENVTVTWEGSDLDGDQLTYMVSYSADSGTTWIPIGMDIKETSLNWTTPSGTPTENYLVKVIASDGINTEEDISDSTFTVGFHDVAVTNLVVSKQSPSPGETIYINVTIENQGYFTETFNASVYYTLLYDPLIGTQNVTLTEGANTTLTFAWTPNMSGRYEILANTTEIPNDIDPINNTRTTIVYVGNGGSNSGKSASGLHMASFILAIFTSVIVLAFRKNRGMSLSDMPASIIKQNIDHHLPDKRTNIWQDHVIRQTI